MQNTAKSARITGANKAASLAAWCTAMRFSTISALGGVGGAGGAGDQWRMAALLAVLAVGSGVVICTWVGFVIALSGLVVRCHAIDMRAPAKTRQV